jgi:hypothetical protein
MEDIMSNMSYCRFQNTAGDLADCQSALENLLQGGSDEDGIIEVLSRDELHAAKRLAVTCQNILDLLAESVGKPIEDMDEADLECAIEEANASAEEEKKLARAEEER